MKETPAETFLIPGEVDPATVFDAVLRQFTAKIQRPHREKRIYYDTFDWALYQHGLSLTRTTKVYSLRSLKDDRVLVTNRLKSVRPPGFQELFPGFVVAGKLKGILELRVLLTRGRVEAETQTAHILDKLEKTVVHVRIEKIRAGQSPSVNLITLKPVKGYQKHFSRVAQLLGDVSERCEAADVLRLVLKAAGESPDEYSAGSRDRLDPEMSARDALVLILRRLLDVMRQNEPGVIADIDTECLHDFRVAVRRTRAALQQIKDVFPSGVVKPFRESFAVLGKASNRLRDLDVYLLSRSQYEAMLPEQLAPSLSALFEILAADRRREQKSFVTVLKSSATRSLLSEWEVFLKAQSADIPEKPKNAGKPVAQLARKYIVRQHRRVMTLGGKIDDSTPDSELHKLRIQCKNLRYMLEFFATLLPQTTAKALIGQLKSLQDNLGEFNDLCVQQVQLESFMSRIRTLPERSVETAAAVGGLIAALHQRQQEVRRAFAKVFREFADEKGVRLYRELFT